MRLAALLALVAMTSPAIAQDDADLRGDWLLIYPQPSSGSLAMSGFDQTAAAGLSWPDGRQAVVTFWTLQAETDLFIYRCVSYFDAALVPTGEQCARATMPN